MMSDDDSDVDGNTDDESVNTDSISLAAKSN